MSVRFFTAPRRQRAVPTRTLLTDTMGRIGNLLWINDIEHAESLMTELRESRTWSTDLQKHKDYKKYEFQIEDGKTKGKRRSGQSMSLRRYLTTDPPKTFQQQRKIQMDRVKKVYGSGAKRFYTYFLMNLDLLEVEEEPTFKTFLRSVVYIGKGVGQRSRKHGRDALDIPEDEVRFHGRKLQTIRRLLDSSLKAIGIVETNLESSEKEAYAYEHAMIRAMGLAALTNATPESMPLVGEAINKKKKEGDEEYTEKRVKEKKVKQPRWTDEQIETIGVDRLINAWESAVVTVHRREYLPYEEDDEAVDEVDEEEKNEEEDQEEEDQEEEDQEEEDQDVVEEEKKKKKAERERKQKKAKKERRRQSQDRRSSGVVEAQKGEKRKRPQPTRQSPVSGQKKRKMH